MNGTMGDGDRGPHRRPVGSETDEIPEGVVTRDNHDRDSLSGEFKENCLEYGESTTRARTWDGAETAVSELARDCADALEVIFDSFTDRLGMILQADSDIESHDDRSDERRGSGAGNGSARRFIDRTAELRRYRDMVIDEVVTAFETRIRDMEAAALGTGLSG